MARIVRKTPFHYQGKVHDLTVENSHSYNVEGLGVHNSAGGSLLSYCLGITQVDPIRFGLLFERFLVRGKKGFPDIDSDFSDREQATKLIADYFGKENVISVSSFTQLQVTSLIKDLAKLFNVPFEEVNAYTAKMRNEALAEAKKEPGFDAGVWQFTVEMAERDSPSFREFMDKMQQYPEFELALNVLFKQMRGVGRHAGGVIITSNTRENMPIIKSGGQLQTPWPEGVNFRHLEEFGFLKFDILGLGTLRMFEECIKKIIRKERGFKHVPYEMVKEWFWKNLHPDNNDLLDPKVYEHVYWNNHYAGVFQFVKKNVQDFMVQMKPNNIIDIAIATSIFRPGPLGIGADKLYLNNRLNPQDIRYKHPLLQDALGATSGLIIFQEQLQFIYNKLAGVPLEETDAVRKAFTKKDISNRDKAAKDRENMREDFATRCLAVNQIEKRVSYDIFDEMEKYVAYSFNKSLLFSTDVHVYTKHGEFVATKQIQDIVAGDFVRSRDEASKQDCFVAVAANHDHGTLDVFEVEFENGKKVSCTLDHKFRVKDGRMLPLGQILDENLDIIFDEEEK